MRVARVISTLAIGFLLMMASMALFVSGLISDESFHALGLVIAAGASASIFVPNRKDNRTVGHVELVQSR